MAGDWLKIEICTPDKPEVIGIADILGIPPAHAFGSLFFVWRWFDQHTTSGNASYVTKVTIDRLSGNAGFADAMVKVGWLIINDDESVTLPHFDNHNGETAKQRGLTAKRVAKSKLKTNAISNARVTVDALPREEKRREDIKPTTLSEYSDEFEWFWDVYPKKTGKGGAYTAWKKQRPPLQMVLKSLEWQAKTEDWTKQNGQFIPMPATYLNQRRWEDGGSSDHSKPFDVNEFMKKANGL